MKKNDIYLIIGILGLALIAFGIIQVTKSAGAQVVVYIDGAEEERFDLNKDTTYTIETEDGGYNVLVIEDGVAYLSDANCPDQLCMGMGKIQYDGETIVCLPHKVVVEIDSDEKASAVSGDSEGIDVIAQ